MIVNEARFFALFVLTALAFFLVPVRWRHAVLIGSGAVFYAWYAPPVLPLVLALVVLTRVASGRLGVWLNVLALVALMAYLKVQSNHDGLPGILTPEAASRSLVFPLGLSFLSFELIHVAVERGRGNITKISLASLAAFALYFPCRVAGPIKRFQPFETSLREARWSAEQLYRGSVRILWGFFKKAVLADVIGLVVPELHWATSPLQVWKAMVAYSFYIFLDFSAYSDVAIGMSWILGLRVPENFRWPYLSRNIREFWSRWHMSLSSWLGDYLFLPIGRRLALAPWRLAPWMAGVIAYLVTFTICGLWHGPTLNFLLWGLFHGGLLSLYVIYLKLREALPKPAVLHTGCSSAVGRILSPALTFLMVTMGWMLFAVQLPKARGLWAILWRVRG